MFIIAMKTASRIRHKKPEGLIERMVLASSQPVSRVFDPFAGSGTTLRVCQQTERSSLGIEINPEYVEMIRQRLQKPFFGFDSIDPRMERVPNDLNAPVMREQYLENHLNWFLKNHQNQESRFWQEVEEKYQNVSPRHAKKMKQKQMPLLME